MKHIYLRFAILDEHNQGRLDRESFQTSIFPGSLDRVREVQNAWQNLVIAMHFHQWIRSKRNSNDTNDVSLHQTYQK